MSAATIDYDALAQQHGGSAAVDYDALAAQHGGTTQNAPPTATISATHEPDSFSGKVEQWTKNVANDIKYGTDTTGVGTVLKKMGAHGVYQGNSEAVGDFMASLPLGIAKMTQGGAEVAQPGQRWQGTKDVASGAMQAATIPASFVAPEAGETAASGLGSALDKINPSAMKEAAGGILQAVAHDANKVPVALENAGDAALKLMDWQKKTQLGPTLNKFLNRITNPKLGPMTYEEGRDFYSLLSRMSADEQLKMAAPVKFQVQQLTAGLKQDIGNAADQVGRAADYYRGMRDYAKAAKLQDWYDTTKTYLIRGALGAVGAGAAGVGAHYVYDSLQK
ncbi:MAG: hypothetical protein JWQ87_2256 [Candidatus Sulfotelmatobacter sp.]|nr:hypothetical protein [Candidatus Sulfotelmatobacter sp.]